MKEVAKQGVQYLDVPPPVRGMHFCIYPMSVVVVFTPRRVDQVIPVCYLPKKISDTVEDIPIEEMLRSLAVINVAFEPL